MTPSNSKIDDDTKYDILVINDDHKNKVVSTKFAYVVAPSGGIVDFDSFGTKW